MSLKKIQGWGQQITIISFLLYEISSFKGMCDAWSRESTDEPKSICPLFFKAAQPFYKVSEPTSRELPAWDSPLYGLQTYLQGLSAGSASRFARASSYVTDFNTRNKLLTQRLLKQGYRYHKLRETFSKFYRQYYDLISKFQVGLKSLLRHGLTEPEFYGDLVYKLKKIVGSNNFSAQLIKIIFHYKKIGYNNNALQQTACLGSTQSRLATLLSALIARRWVGLQTL